jgi:hypothetical protein
MDWFQFSFLNIPDNLRDGNKVWLLNHMDAKRAQLLFCKTVVSVTLWWFSKSFLTLPFLVQAAQEANV